MEFYRYLIDKPILEFCLVHSHGVVWDMKWCPSGCYNIEKSDGDFLPRIGLLALACSDGNIPIYTVALANISEEG